MRKLKAIILLLIVFAAQITAQDIVHLCVGDSHNFAVPYTNGSVYDWKMENTPIATITSGSGTEHITMNLTSSGTFQLIVEELNINGCFGYDSILVEIHDKPTPIISALGPVQVCLGIDVILQVNTIFDSYLWSDGSSASELVVDSTGDYSVIVTDEFGCVNNSNAILVDVQSANATADFYFEGICVNSPTTFLSTSSSVGGVINSLSWDFGNGVQYYSDSVSVSYSLVGDYQVSLFIESAAGCKDSIIKTITIFGNPTANFTYNPYTISTLNPEINFINTSTNGALYLWDFGDSIYSEIESPSHIYDDPGAYDVMLIIEDVNECMDSITKYIVMYYDFVLHVPSAFTANDDGNNDSFCPQGLRMDKYESYEFSIFNRFGEIIFETDKINECWNGEDSQHGSYAWVIVIVDELGAERKKVGSVLLIK
jgi:gliding motility-associated-like protein